MPATDPAVRERPILFSGPMVQAIMAGRKTQTRRVAKGPIEFCGAGGESGPDWDDPSCWGWADQYGDWHTLAPEGQSSCDDSCCIPCPYGRVGDRLWVRETFSPRVDVDPTTDLEKARHYARYAADSGDLDNEWHHYDGWKPSIHMPRWASRLTLEISAVRVERLQAIGEEDAIAEGIFNGDYDPGLAKGGKPGWCYAPGRFAGTPRHGYELLWDSINGKRAPWESNPWVWALTFRRLQPTGGD